MASGSEVVILESDLDDEISSDLDFIDVASDSEASRPSMLYSQMMQSISLYSSADSDLSSVTNTIDLSSCRVAFAYKNTYGSQIWSVKHLDSSGHFSFALPSDFKSSVRFEIRMPKSALPPAGKYKFYLSFFSDTGGFTYTKSQFYSQKNIDNADYQYTVNFVSVTQSSGDAYLTTSIDIGNIDTLNVSLETTDLIPPFGGTYKVQFTKLSSSASTDLSVAGGSYTSADAASDTANNTAQIVEKQDKVIDQIVATTETISMQISAFWNQLAGELTNLFNKMNEQHAEQMESDEETRNTISQEAEESRNFIVNGIINGLKSLFIPSEDYFKSWFDDMYAFFDERLGFLMLPVDLVVRLANMYLDAGSSFAGVPFPEFKWLDGTVIIPAQSVQFTFLETDWGQGIQDKLYFVGNLIMIGALLSLMHRKFEEVLRN